MAKIKYWQSIHQGISEEMERDPRVVLLGEDVGMPGGPFGATRGLQEKFGRHRVRDTPISELAIAGIGVGAAMTGMRPIVEIMFNDFSTLAMDQIVNQAAKMSFMSGGKITVPFVIRTMVASRMRTGPQHGQSLEAIYAHIPGIKVVWPSNPADMKGLLKSAIRDDNPVIVFESLALWTARGEVPDGEYTIPIGKARMVREGNDVSILSIGSAVNPSIEAADELEKEGIHAEVIDLRSISPLDEETIFRSISKTGRAVIVHDAVKSHGVGAEIAARINEELFDTLKAPPKRIASPFSPVPFAPQLEQQYFPQRDQIAAGVKDLLQREMKAIRG